MADGVDAAMDAVQPSCAEPAVDRRRRQLDGVQLRRGDDPVLARRERSEADVAGWDEKFVVCGSFSSHLPARARPAGPRP